LFLVIDYYCSAASVASGAPAQCRCTPVPRRLVAIDAALPRRPASADGRLVSREMKDAVEVAFAIRLRLECADFALVALDYRPNERQVEGVDAVVDRVGRHSLVAGHRPGSWRHVGTSWAVR
jgi:hypothetical protein